MVQFYLIRAKHGNYYQFLVLDKYGEIPGIDCQTEQSADRMTNDGCQSIKP